MEALLTALADPARWRLVSLLAERPRPVGVLAQLAGARQPQTTKHLQALERAGLVVSRRTGQRRIYALRSAALRDLAAALNRLADLAEQPGGPGEVFERHGLSLDAARLEAREPGWADGRSFTFHRSLAADPGLSWRHLTETALLARWWTPDDLRVSELVFEARPGGRIVHEYRDAEDADGSDVVAGRAEESSTSHTPASACPTGSPRGSPAAGSPSPPTSTSSCGPPAPARTSTWTSGSPTAPSAPPTSSQASSSASARASTSSWPPWPRPPPPPT
ncbi:metalloregulator ArsR/SmtB family transcription factor [Nonomuraea thailandensis]